MAAAFEAGRTLPARSLELFFDYTCPYAYLGFTRARALAERMGVPLTLKPILLGGVFRAVGTDQNLFASLAPAKAEHNGLDMARWAVRFGVPLRMPPNHPMRSVSALRATLVTGVDPAVVARFYRAYWDENRDIADRAVLASVLTDAGHDADAVLARIDEPAVKDDLRARTDEAIARGVFGVPAWFVDTEHLYWGQDRIAFVEGLRPSPPDEEAQASSRRGQPELEVFWDFSSPFAYLGMTQARRVAERHGARLTSRPILLGGLFRTLGTPDVPLATWSEAKQKHTYADLHRWAQYWDVPFRFPTRFPVHSLAAMRMYLALPTAAREHYRDATFRAYWAEDRDIADASVLTELARAAIAAVTPGGADAHTRGLEEVLARASGDEVKGALRAATDEAARRGVFGVPTWIVDGELFWGQDRLDLVEDRLAGR
ncbi:MAG: 2-hydroxychromene-2-carboxylate isomerase [Myxococcales bacterium]|nr:2-hydroxychromene-2-carboxylate isomerase [Myxococcales bacterium]